MCVWTAYTDLGAYVGAYHGAHTLVRMDTSSGGMGAYAGRDRNQC